MIPKSRVYTIERLQSFSISDIDRNGYSLEKLERLSKPIKGTMSLGKGSSKSTVGLILNPSPLSISFVYAVGGRNVERRFYIRKRESNLISGSFMYFFVCPNSGKLCRKLYIFGGEIVSRYKLQDLGIMYDQQTRGHNYRRVWSYYYRIPDNDSIKYRKSHYRGFITPFWERLTERDREGSRRVLEELSKNL